MKKCDNCGNEINAEAKFCPKCGTKQQSVVPNKGEDNQEDNKQVKEQANERIADQIPEQDQEDKVVTQTTQTTQTPQVSHTDQNLDTVVENKNQISDTYSSENSQKESETANNYTAESLASNETVQQTLAASKGYFKYMVDKLKNPNSGIEGAQSYYGYVTYGLVTLLSAWLIVLAANRVGQFLMQILYEFGDPISFYGAGFAEWFKLSILGGLLFAIPILVLYFTVRLLVKSTDSLIVMVNKLANFLYPALALAAVACLLAVTQIVSSSFSVITLLFVVASASYAIIFVTYDYIREARITISTFYVLLGTSLISGILAFLVMSLFV